MSRHRHDVRRLAMQLLFQLDVRGIEDSDNIRDALTAAAHEPKLHEEAFALAMAAWETHSESDERVTAVAPDWPSYRQPPVDRAILRLAYHEITTGRVPVKIAINEAVELAKQFASEESPPFVNGVLDKMHRQLRDEGRIPEPKPQPNDGGGDNWLADAMNEPTAPPASNDEQPHTLDPRP